MQYFYVCDMLKYYPKLDGGEWMELEYNGKIDEFMRQIRHIMVDKGLRQKDICNATGWSRQTVSNLLAGRTNSPGINLLYDLCKAVGYKMYIDIR